MEIVFSILFLIISHFALMQIFRISTYHSYFWKSLPLLIAYSALVGWLLFTFNLHKFFIWQVVLSSIWLFSFFRKTVKNAKELINLGGYDEEGIKIISISSLNTITYLLYSSLIYVFVFSAVYLWRYNN